MAAAATEPPALAASLGVDGLQKEQPSEVLLEQSFEQLEAALEGGIWEVDGDDLSLYVCDGATPGEGAAGAVVVSQGPCDAEVELVHQLRQGTGARVDRLSACVICEELDFESCGTFTIGLAFDEDFEEASLLALTLRHKRVVPEDEGEATEPSRAVELQLNGQVIETDIGALPVRLELETELRWGRPRAVALRYRLTPEREGGPGPSRIAEAAADFYTTTVAYERAQALCLRGTGTIKVKLVNIRCLACSEGA